jgi:hypothetical protein
MQIKKFGFGFSCDRLSCDRERLIDPIYIVTFIYTHLLNTKRWSCPKSKFLLRNKQESTGAGGWEEFLLFITADSVRGTLCSDRVNPAQH